MGFIVRVDVVSKGFAFGIEDDGDVAARMAADQASYHIDDALYRACRLASAGN